ncbi:helix-turn-helix domain-containing protein [Staphylococcus sp. 11261D007BR]
MNDLIQYAYHKAHPYKTVKSIYNIIIGKKSHQTFFDATTLNLLTLFGYMPSLSYAQFQSLASNETQLTSINTTTHVTFYELSDTFTTLQLLIQTLSHRKHHQLKFLPITSNIQIHTKVKQIYHDIQYHDDFAVVEQEVFQLFESLNKRNPNSILHYYLCGYQEAMYTDKQICSLNRWDENQVAVQFYNDLVELYKLLKQTSSFSYLTKCKALPHISIKVANTLKWYQQGWSLQNIAHHSHVTFNTIEDHVLDLFIKGYINDYHAFVTQINQRFIQYYDSHPYLKLKHYKSIFEDMSYFELKLHIIGIAKGDLKC